MKPGSNTLVHLPEQQPIGYQFKNRHEDWPLHITLVPWFYIDEPQEEGLFKDLQGICEATETIDVLVGNPELFGPGSKPVNVIPDEVALHGLHKQLLHRVDESDAELQVPRTQVGRLYRPHITLHPTNSAERGSVLTVGSLARISINGKQCTVDQIFEIGQRVEEAA